MIHICHIHIAAGINETVTLHNCLIRNCLLIHKHLTVIFICHITLFPVKQGVICAYKVIAVVSSTDICIDARIGSSVLQHTQHGTVSFGNSEQSIINTRFMHKIISSLRHIPSVKTGIVTALRCLSVIKIDNRTSSFRHQQIAFFIRCACPEIRKHIYRNKRIILFILNFIHRNRYQ